MLFIFSYCSFCIMDAVLIFTHNLYQCSARLICPIYRLCQQTSARDTIGVGHHGCVLIVGNYHIIQQYTSIACLTTLIVVFKLQSVYRCISGGS